MGGTFASLLTCLFPNAMAFSAMFLLFAVDSIGDFPLYFLDTAATFMENQSRQQCCHRGMLLNVGMVLGMDGGVVTAVVAATNAAA